MKSKRLCAYFLLIVLILGTLMLTYIKFFSTDNTYIEEIPVDDSSSNAIHNALKDISNSFNSNYKMMPYNNEFSVSASVNNYSIYVSYIRDETVTYEFKYNRLFLEITVLEDVDKDSFYVAYKLLVLAAQKRLNNDDDIVDVIDKFLNDDMEVDGLSKEKTDNRIKYKIDITKKIKLESGGI